MTAINILPKMETKPLEASNTTTIEHDFTVPANKRWLLDYIEVEFGTQDATNTVDIEHPVGTSIWSQLENFKRQGVDFATRYPRAPELEGGDVLRLVFTRGVATTIPPPNVYILESDE